MVMATAPAKSPAAKSRGWRSRIFHKILRFLIALRPSMPALTAGRNSCTIITGCSIPMQPCPGIERHITRTGGVDLIFEEYRWLLLAVWVAIISLLAIIFTVHDKSCAKKGKWRVPENTLMLLGALGGAAAMFFTMRCIRHKTKHLKFMLGLPVLFLLHLTLLVFAIWKWGF